MVNKYLKKNSTTIVTKELQMRKCFELCSTPDSVAVSEIGQQLKANADEDVEEEDPLCALWVWKSLCRILS